MSLPVVNNKKILGAFSLAMIAVVAIIDLRGLPMMASYGLGAIFVYGLAMVLFLIPSGLVCAELATNIQKPGGMYAWICDSFGDNVGFIAIWLEWLNNVIGFPASLSFICVTLMYLFDPGLAQNKALVFTATVCILWVTTGFILLGMKASSRLNMSGALFGTIVPALIITVLGFSWVLLGKPVQIALNWHHVIPTMQASNPGIFATLILGFGGMQIIAFHTANARNPGRDYPRAIFAAVAIIFGIALCTSMAVALVVPSHDLDIISGLINSFQRIFTAFSMSWATPLVVVLIVFSSLATFDAWFLGPARGLVVAAQNGFFPRIFSYCNRQDMPAAILLLQAVSCTILSAVFLYMPDLTSGFWILLNLSSQSALMVYMLIFAAAIKQRLLRTENLSHAYYIPGGKLGVWIVAGTGFVTCAMALLCSVIPPTNINTGNFWHYEAILFGSNAIFISIPLAIIYYYSRRRRLEHAVAT